MITNNVYKALRILEKAGIEGVTASGFAVSYYTEPKHGYLFTAVSNQGNGACAGKKAWLCAGSYLGRLVKKGLVRKRIPREAGAVRFTVTNEGISAIREYSIKKATRTSHHTDFPSLKPEGIEKLVEAARQNRVYEIMKATAEPAEPDKIPGSDSEICHFETHPNILSPTKQAVSVAQQFQKEFRGEIVFDEECWKSRRADGQSIPYFSPDIKPEE